MPDPTESPTPVLPPVIVFPLHGCADIQALTEEQEKRQLREWRMALRQSWNHAGVRALVGLVELTTARLTRNAIAPGATEHDQGQAFGVSQMLSTIRFVVTGEEQDD